MSRLMRRAYLARPSGSATDLTPDAVNWTGGSATHTAPSGRVWSDAKQVTGISAPITLSVPTGSGDWAAGTFKAWVSDSEFGIYTEVASGAVGATLTFAVAPGQWVKYSFDGSTAKGRKSGTAYVIVQNASDGYATLDASVVVTLTVDSDDVFGYDYTPAAQDWVDLSLSTAAASGSVTGTARLIGGIEKPIKITPVLALNSGGSGLTVVLTPETSPDASTWTDGSAATSVNGSTGYGAQTTLNPETWLRFRVNATASDGSPRSGSYLVKIYNDSDGGSVLDTFAVTVAVNQ